LERKIDVWRNSVGGNFFFRPYCKEEGEEPKAFLFCYQSAWQKNLLMRYQTVVLLDATYKTTKYALPLFTLVVKTNVNYINVGVFVVLHEDTDSIAEALKIFQSWNPDWKPSYFLVDYSIPEMNAITICFPSCRIYICDFHRLQAWQRWLKTTTNVPRAEDAEELLKLFKKLAISRNDQEFLVAETKLYDSDSWKRNEKAQKYFCSTWLPVKDKWTQSFFDREYLFIINTNNGNESQNKTLKYSYLRNHIDKSLCGVLEIILTEYLSDALHTYQSSNSSLDSGYKNYNDAIPDFLYKRPISFIRHVYQRYATAQSVYSRNSITLVEDDSDATFCRYVIKSETNVGENHLIDPSIPFCSCDDFFKYRFPCKHICALILYIPDFSFHSLPSSYLGSPYITIDPIYSVFSNEF